MSPVNPESGWHTLYRVGALSALVFLVMVLIPMVLVFIAPVPPTEGLPLLEYIVAHRAVYLVQLVCFVGLAVPAMVVFAALAAALAHVDRSVAVIGGLFGIASEIVALAVGSSPQSLHGGLVVLSDAYQAAGTDAARAGLASAAEALIATANAMPWAGVLTAASILVLSLVVRQAGFGTALAVVGVFTGALGVVSEVLRPMIGLGYLLYGLLLPIWFGWVGWKLFMLSRQPA